MTNDATIDIYALTNPAFWAIALSHFAKGCAAGCTSSSASACAYPLLFLPLPFTFSREALARFERTNKRTGLMTWLERNPAVRATAATDIVAAKPFTRRALTFALAHDLITTSDGWNYTAGAGRGWKRPKWPAQSDPRGAVLQACTRLGQWCAAADLPTIYISLGARP